MAREGGARAPPFPAIRPDLPIGRTADVEIAVITEIAVGPGIVRAIALKTPPYVTIPRARCPVDRRRRRTAIVPIGWRRRNRAIVGRFRAVDRRGWWRGRPARRRATPGIVAAVPVTDDRRRHHIRRECSPAVRHLRHCSAGRRRNGTCHRKQTAQQKIADLMHDCLPGLRLSATPPGRGFTKAGGPERSVLHRLDLGCDHGFSKTTRSSVPRTSAPADRPFLERSPTVQRGAAQLSRLATRKLQNAC